MMLYILGICQLLYYYTFYIYAYPAKMHSVPLKRKSLDIIGIGASESPKNFLKKVLTSLTVCDIIFEHAQGLGANYAQNPSWCMHDMR